MDAGLIERSLRRVLATGEPVLGLDIEVSGALRRMVTCTVAQERLRNRAASPAELPPPTAAGAVRLRIPCRLPAGEHGPR